MSRLVCVALLLGSIGAFKEADGAQAVYSDDRNSNIFPPAFQFGSYGAGTGLLNGPSAVAVGPGDRVYVADTRNHRISVFSLQGKPLGGWGAMGSGPSDFLFPSGVAVGPDGEVFVADAGNHRVQGFDPQGKFLREWGRHGADPGSFQFPVAVAVSKDTVCVAERDAHRVQVFSRTGELRKAFGGFGDGPGQLKEPLGVAVDDDGGIFVADSGNHRIQRFDREGNPLSEWGKWGPHPAFFSFPSGLAMSGGRLTVADSANHRVQVFDRSGSLLSQWGRAPVRPREGNGRLHFPSAVAVNPSGGYTVVCEPVEHRLQVFANGTARALKRVNDFPWWDDLHQRTHGMPPVPGTYKGPSIWDVNPPLFAPILEQDTHGLLCYDLARRPAFYLGRSTGYGRKLGEFSGPGRCALDLSNRQMWVTDRYNRRIQVLELPRDDQSITGFGIAPKTLVAVDPAPLVPSSVAGFRADRLSLDSLALHPRGEVYIVDSSHGLLLVFDRTLKFLRALRPPAPPSGRPPRIADVAFSVDGRSVYVLDRANFRVAILDEDGRERGAWGRYGSDSPEAFQDPAGIATDTVGFVYVTDRAMNRVRKFDPAGKFVLEWGGLGHEAGQFHGPEAITIATGGYLVVDDVGNHRGQAFGPDGKVLQTFSKGGSAGPVPR